MRNAASALGILGGLFALLIGVSTFGYTEVLYRFGEVPDWAELPDNAAQLRAVSVLAPILAIAGGATARDRALWAGLMLLAAAGSLYWAFGFGAFTIFPITMCGLGGLLTILSPQPDAPKSHGPKGRRPKSDQRPE